VGSTPTGVFYKQGLTSLGQRRAAHSINGWCCVFRTWTLAKAMLIHHRLAQWKEHQTDNLAVAGSNPVPTSRLNLLEARERPMSPRVADRLFGRPRECCFRFGEMALGGTTNRSYVVRGYRVRARSI
jgi:hypothetical protein